MADFGDGMTTGADLVGAAESAVAQALEPLANCRPDLLCVFVSGSRDGADQHTVEEAGRTAMKRADAPSGGRSPTANGTPSAPFRHGGGRTRSTPTADTATAPDWPRSPTYSRPTSWPTTRPEPE